MLQGITMRFIVKVSPETFIKSRSVRSRYIKQLWRNIHKILTEIHPCMQVFPMWDRVEVECPDEVGEACRQRLCDVPGISKILMVDSYPLPEENPLDFISAKAIEYFSEQIDGKSFAVQCKRQGKHAFTSMDVNRHVGGVLLDNATDSSVNIKTPDVIVPIEVIQKKVHFVRSSTVGMQGYPFGTQGTVLSLMSGGYDSSVASYQMMRRGCRVNFLFFNLGGPAHLLGAQQAAQHLWKKYGASHPARFYTVSLDHFIADLMALPHMTFNGVLLKRAMIRIANDISSRTNIEALVTGESIAQVSSQTLQNLSVIDKASEELIVRPLITMGKGDIISVAEEIGTAVFAENMVEYCGTVSKKPTVSASLKTVQKIERKIGDTWFESAISSIKNIAVSEIDLSKNGFEVEQVAVIEGQTVIDINMTDSPIEESELAIPFYDINDKFAELPQDKEYLLYCDRGLASEHHATHLKEHGFNNVNVYRPTS
ncbi:tRNA 4-thiouridine(8) synthase ThiI [Leucothrix sargassi]|nr:tRNA 4-thiouridine(8) synthase ThiI [Leucothrix sargassi]